MKQNIRFRRRHFIKTFAFATACSSLLGRSWRDVFAADVKLLASSTTGVLRLKLTDFPALLNESGSVRLGINPLRGDLMPDGQFHPVIINRGPNNTFYALNSRCTHEGCAVDPLDPSSNRMFCQCHGSQYAIDGRRLVGPAISSLSKYTVTFDGTNELQIQIPNLGYSLTPSNVQSAAGGTRLRLDFRALRNVSYEVRFRESLEKPATPVSFATTQSGAADQDSFTAPGTANVSLFVEPKSTAGFYTVAVQVTEL